LLAVTPNVWTPPAVGPTIVHVGEFAAQLAVPGPLHAYVVSVETFVHDAVKAIDAPPGALEGTAVSVQTGTDGLTVKVAVAGDDTTPNPLFATRLNVYAPGSTGATMLQLLEAVEHDPVPGPVHRKTVPGTVFVQLPCSSTPLSGCVVDGIAVSVQLGTPGITFTTVLACEVAPGVLVAVSV
jgi:hypothetical protein